MADSPFKWGSAPNPVFGGNYYKKKEDRQERKILKFRTLRLWSGARPCSPLGEEPVGRLGVLVPLGPMRILHHALSKTTCADRRLPCPPANRTMSAKRRRGSKRFNCLNLQS